MGERGIGRVIAFLLLLPFLGGLWGCVGFRGPEDLGRDLGRTAGVELQRETGVTVGRGGTWLARKVLKWSGEPEAGAMLRGVRRVEVGVYEVEGPRRGCDGGARLRLSDLPAWTPMVHVRDGGDDVFVLVDRRRESIRRMLVVVAGGDEWTVVRIHGRLDRVLEDAMRFAFDQAERPDLYDRTREEREKGDTLHFRATPPPLAGS